MSENSHIHTDDFVVDADVHFLIDTVTRQISNINGDKVNKKLTIMQYDNKSERYSFDIDRKIDGHDLTLCNRVQIHFVNKGLSRNQITSRSYTVDDVHVNDSDENKLSFSWLISDEATQYSGTLHFLVTFECVDGDKILYRWSTTTYTDIRIVEGMNNNNEIFDTYSDELLTWQNKMQDEYIPQVVDERYIERDFATSEEVAYIFDMTEPDALKSMSIDDMPTDDSSNLIKSGGVKSYVDTLVATLEARISALEQN